MVAMRYGAIPSSASKCKNISNMALTDFVYRTKTYLAGDWTGDKDLIDKLHEWNNNDNLALSFVDVHELTQSSDTIRLCRE